MIRNYSAVIRYQFPAWVDSISLEMSDEPFFILLPLTPPASAQSRRDTAQPVRSQGS